MSPPANVRPPSLQNVGIEQHLDGQVPPDLTFRDEAGQTVRLGDYFGKKPVILNLVYYRCPTLCSMLLGGLKSALDQTGLELGTDYTVVTVSIDPTETPKLAAEKKLSIAAQPGWSFLVGTEPAHGEAAQPWPADASQDLQSIAVL